jgi:hypothetical protein
LRQAFLEPDSSHVSSDQPPHIHGERLDRHTL